MDFRDLVELSQLSASPSASARDRSRSPVPRISDPSSSGYTVDRASGFLPSGRPLPPEPPVKAGPATASSSSSARSARPSSAPPLPPLPPPPVPSTLPLTRPLVKSKARPKARPGPVIPPAWPQPKQLPVPERTVGLRRVYNNPSELGDAINAACADFPGASKILSLDCHNVADRNTGTRSCARFVGLTSGQNICW